MRGKETTALIIERDGELLDHFFRVNENSFAHLLCMHCAFVRARHHRRVLPLAAASLPSPNGGRRTLLPAGGADLLVQAGAHIGRRL